MVFNFKQSVCLEGKDYARGAHELSGSVLEKLSENETFLQYKKIGLIQESDKGQPASAESLMENQKKIVEQVAPKAIAPEAEKVDESSDAVASKEQASVKSKSKKR